jgi:GNAT superfamily N-acetyltransferase
MSLQIRQATPDDVNGIANVMTTVWPEEPVDHTQLYSARSLTQKSCTHVIADRTTIAGFGDSFMTYDANGRQRWEVDLLAVHPTYQGQGWGKRLVQSATEAGRAAGASYARGLIEVQNRASQRAFASCGYQCQPAWLKLYVNDGAFMGQLCAMPASHVVPVHTLRYSGFWLEDSGTERLSPEVVIPAKEAGNLLGRLIPIEEEEACAAYAQMGFDDVGHFQFWMYNLSEMAYDKYTNGE